MVLYYIALLCWWDFLFISRPLYAVSENTAGKQLREFELCVKSNLFNVTWFKLLG